MRDEERVRKRRRGTRDRRKKREKRRRKEEKGRENVSKNKNRALFKVRYTFLSDREMGVKREGRGDKTKLKMVGALFCQPQLTLLSATLKKVGRLREEVRHQLLFAALLVSKNQLLHKHTHSHYQDSRKFQVNRLGKLKRTWISQGGP